MDNEDEDFTTLFLFSWDMYGLEACIDITNEYEKKAMWNSLQGKVDGGELNHIVGAILMRARMNPQRHYEVYTVNISASVTKDELVKMFEENPQGMADLIRERGNKVYSDRVRNGGQPRII